MLIQFFYQRVIDFSVNKMFNKKLIEVKINYDNLNCIFIAILEPEGVNMWIVDSAWLIEHDKEHEDKYMRIQYIINR